MIAQPCSPATLPPDRRGRLRNGAAPGDFLAAWRAAALCGTDQPTLSKVLSGRMTSISMDQLTRWLNALGRSVEIKVKRARGPATTVVIGA